MGGYNDDGTGFNHQDTSEAAADAVNLNWRERVYRVLVDAGPNGLADYEIEEITGNRNAGQRRGELVNEGRVRNRGSVKKNPETGVHQIVWTAYDEQGKLL